MRIILISAVILLSNTLLLTNTIAQEMPLVYNVENTCTDFPAPYMPTVSELPTVESLTNPFLWSDGRGQIENFSDWKYRRAEIGAEIQHYEIGEKPTRPDNIEASYTDGTLTVHVTVNDKTLTLTSQITLPEGEGPFPAVIGMGGASGSLPSDIFSSRDIAQIPFNFGQVMAHTQSRGSEPINRLYPELENMGSYSAWPWGVSRLIDGLELVSEDLNIDLERLAVTGCSFAGKMALFAGAFDERIALTISQESGGGGYTSWRFSESMNESVERLGVTNSAWFKEDFIPTFGNNVNKLPFDHHELMAMVAPRALLVTGNDGQVWLADESGYVASNAAQKVWDALEVPDRFGYYNVGGHNHCALTPEKREVIEAYVDKFLLGDEDANTDVAASPYTTNLAPWIIWETPELGNDSSYFGKTSLATPADREQNLDTRVTLKWHSFDEVERYHFVLSENPSFRDVIMKDSLTDTLKTIEGLQQGQRYYWRVQVENSEGLKGPWSNQFTFSTKVPLPLAPKLNAVEPYPGRADYVTFSWEEVEHANRYFLELAEDEEFSVIEGTYNGSNTSKILNGIDEGERYYWRVRASNIVGDSEWSDVSDFVIIAAPENLTLENNSSQQITLRWDDESEVEEGFIIERKGEAEGEFTTIDTVAENTTSYVDRDLEGDLTSYSYRVKAFMGTEFSNYTSEKMLTAVNIEDQTNTPSEFKLGQNYPNPFNPTTNIQFEIPQATSVQLAVFNMLGQKVETLVNGRIGAGVHSILFDASNLPSGLYFYMLKAGDFTQTRQLSLIK